MKPLPLGEVVIGALAGGAIALASHAGWLEGAEWALRDRWLLHRSEVAPDDRVVVVGITDGCLEQIGRWPWPRTRLAELIERIGQAQPRAIGLDVLLSEPDALNPADDGKLADAIGRAGNVVLAGSVGPTEVAHRPAGGPVPEVPAGTTLLFPHARLRARAAGVGHSLASSEPDGLLRRFHTELRIAQAGGARLAVQAFPLVVLSTAVARGLAAPPRPPPGPPSTPSAVIPYHGKPLVSFEVLPASLVIAGEIDRSAFNLKFPQVFRSA